MILPHLIQSHWRPGYCSRSFCSRLSSFGMSTLPVVARSAAAATCCSRFLTALAAGPSVSLSSSDHRPCAHVTPYYDHQCADVRGSSPKMDELTCCNPCSHQISRQPAWRQRTNFRHHFKSPKKALVLTTEPAPPLTLSPASLDPASLPAATIAGVIRSTHL